MTEIDEDIIRIELRKDESGYNVLESSIRDTSGKRTFLLNHEFYFLKDERTYILFQSPSLGNAMRFGSPREDIYSALIQTATDKNYVFLKLRELAREKANKLSDSKGPGCTIEDLTEQ